MVDLLPICFFRIPAKELLGKGFDNIRPRWILLNEDKVMQCMLTIFYSYRSRIAFDLAGDNGVNCPPPPCHMFSVGWSSCSSYVSPSLRPIGGRDRPIAEECLPKARRNARRAGG